MKIKFTHLHAHTSTSVDGLGTSQQFFEKAKQKGFNALAITEHGSLSSVIQNYIYSGKTGVKYIVGNEIYLVIDSQKYHLTILGNGMVGYNSLVELNNLAKRSGFNANTLQDLFNNKEGIIVLSGCPSSPFQKLSYDEAKKLGMRFKMEYGDSFYIEAMDVFDEESQKTHIDRAEALARDLELPIVLTNDVHFIERGYEDVQQIKNIILKGFKYDSTKLFMATPEEILERFEQSKHDEVTQWMQNAYDISQKLETISFDDEPKLPHIENDVDIFKNKVYKAYESYHIKCDERIEKEIDVITKKGYSSYFLIVSEIIQNAKDQNVNIGTGRGSAAGSLVAYLMGITEVDPIKYNLSFERFLNDNRTALPDIDTDIPSQDREVILEYCRKRYGSNGIVTNTLFSEKNTLRDLAHYFNLPKKLENDLSEKGYDSDVYWEVCKDYPLFDKAYCALLDNVRHYGKHAGGIVFTGDFKYPIEVDKNENELIAWTEGSQQELSSVGIVKFDFLGLSVLDMLKEMKNKTGATPPEPYDNAPEFGLLREGKTLGIFQLTGSAGIAQYTEQVSPSRFEDIVAISALWRSGTINAGTHDLYLKHRSNPRKIHPLIDPILEDTYGLIIFQEDFMKLYAYATDRSFDDADSVRRVIVKSKESEIQNIELEFKEGLKSKGIPYATINNLWNEIVTHTGYSFNRSHAVAYSLISWHCLWYKYNFPHEFYSALLNNDPERVQETIFELSEENFFIKKPNINKSDVERFVSQNDDEIFMPLNIKHVGEAGLNDIDANRPFKSAKDFMMKISKRKLPKRGRASLFLVGAFNEISDNYKEFDLEYYDLLFLNKNNDLLKLLKKSYPKKHLEEFYKYLTGITDEISYNQDMIEPIFDENFKKVLSYALYQDKNRLNGITIPKLYNIYEVQEKDFLGYTILTPEIVKKIKDNGGGIVIRKELRKNEKGIEYYSCLLYPYKFFWSRNLDVNIEVGDVVAVKTDKINQLKKYKRI